MYILKIPQLQVSVDNKKIVSDGSLTISEGDVVLLTGPNGCGKSTIIKLLMGDTFNYHKLDSGSTVALFHHGSSELDILSEESNMELFRRNVCYVSQDDVFESEALLDCFLMSLNYCDIENKEEYIYDFVRKFSIQDCFNIDDTLLDRKCRKLIDKLDIDADSLSASDIRAIKLLSLKTSRLSGGQRKLANIVASLVKCEFCRMIILDEPLNNLDYGNVRTFSNILTQIHGQYPSIGILLVTHCRSIPIVNKVIEIGPRTKTLNAGNGYVCNSCFGSVDENKMYI